MVAGRENASLASQLWSIDWSRHFPLKLPNAPHLQFEYATYDECVPFITAHFAEVYKGISNGKFTEKFDAGAKTRFYQLVADFFLLKHDGRPVGIAAGNPTDWSSYNLRNVSIMSEYRGAGAYQVFMPHLLDVLKKHGVLRLEGDIAPTNLPHVHAVNKMGLHITGLNLSERWGAMLHFTAFLDESVRQEFSQHFCEVDTGVRKVAKAS